MTTKNAELLKRIQIKPALKFALNWQRTASKIRMLMNKGQTGLTWRAANSLFWLCYIFKQSTTTASSLGMVDFGDGMSDLRAHLCLCSPGLTAPGFAVDSAGRIAMRTTAYQLQRWRVYLSNCRPANEVIESLICPERRAKYYWLVHLFPS